MKGGITHTPLLTCPLVSTYAWMSVINNQSSGVWAEICFEQSCSSWQGWLRLEVQTVRSLVFHPGHRSRSQTTMKLTHGEACVKTDSLVECGCVMQTLLLIPASEPTTKTPNPKPLNPSDSLDVVVGPGGQARNLDRAQHQETVLLGVIHQDAVTQAEGHVG